MDLHQHKGLRKKLVELLKNRAYHPITSAEVLQAVGEVPRHLFGFDEIFWTTQAYEDKAFPIGEGQTISQPYTVAYQSELLQVKPGDKILEVGTGSGYQAAVLDVMGAKVFTIERHRKLYERTKALLEQLGYKNVKCFFGDGFEGIPAYAPYDKMIITAAIKEYPKKLLQQLKTGGILVMPFGTETNCKMLRITKHGDDNFQTEEFDTFAFVPMLKGKVY